MIKKKSERSCDPAHEFIIFIARFELPYMYIPVCAVSIQTLCKLIREQFCLSTVIIWADKYVFPKNNNEPIYWWLTNACLANSEDLDKKMHFIRVYTVWYDKRSLEKEIQFYLELLSFICLFDLILYVPSTIFQVDKDGSSWVEPVLS